MNEANILSCRTASIIRAMATLANAAYCAVSYIDEQSDAVLMRQLRGDALQSECLMRASKLRLGDINPHWLSTFGFHTATTGGGTEIRLVPLVLAPLIKADTQLYALRDGRAVLGCDIVCDTIVSGCIPYGIQTAGERAKQRKAMAQKCEAGIIDTEQNDAIRKQPRCGDGV